jgi:hypothetical protein
MNLGQICLPQCTARIEPGPAPAPNSDEGNDPHPVEALNAALLPVDPEPSSLLHNFYASPTMTKTASDDSPWGPILVMIRKQPLHLSSPRNGAVLL